MTINNGRSQLVREARRSLREHWLLFVIQGVILVLIGLAAIRYDSIATITTSVVVGWVLFVAGVLRAFSCYRPRHAPGYWSSLLLAILMIVLGALLALFPIQGGQTLTLVLAAYFIAHGLASFALAFSIRGDTGRWVLLGVSGLIDWGLAALIIGGLPGTSLWVLGLYVGINLLFTGLAFIFAALGARAA